MRAAFFDMDRTLVRVNTGNLYILWRFQRREAGLRDVARFARWIALYSVGVIDPRDIQEKALGTLVGVDEPRFREELEQWYTQVVRPYVSEDARRHVERHRRNGDVVAILSASTPYATEPLARDLGIDHVLCSELEVHEGRFTGRASEFCYGAGKVTAAERFAARHGIDLDTSAFYTDSVSDVPMLDRVGEPVVVNPDPRLRWVAKKRGWPVTRWR
jgi:HAD superfamily hydrolase (TIGR01490 family)